MKKNLLFFVFSLLLLGMSSCTPVQNQELKVMTFNVRYDNKGDKDNAWKYRREGITNMINYYSPDVWGGQEVLHHQLTDLKERLTQYVALGVGRSDGKEAGEYGPIFYKKDRFEQLDYGNFGLSENPEQIGKKGWDAACERIATWAILKDKKTNKTFFYLNTHLDHVGVVARREECKLIRQKAHELSGDKMPIIITGDMNSTPDSEVVKHLTENNFLSASRDKAAVVYGPNWTYHDYWRVPLAERTLIDYIFVTKEIKVNNYRVIDDRSNNGKGFISDHNPIISTIEL